MICRTSARDCSCIFRYTKQPFLIALDVMPLAINIGDSPRMGPPRCTAATPTVTRLGRR